MRLRRRGEIVEIATGLPGRDDREPVALERLVREGCWKGQERWLARTKDGKSVYVLVNPIAEGSKR